ncbi:amino acid adenylation domain-containing protein [Amycolatopsis sp.]|uniref:amino acid adenylation domain-containing protein n=1 Tax=Amycolatopsis sp. TaxID=37632 RepID=UPI002D7F7908|nr:amino acid adenylation domain-containing protein [Amycolatopsis sp.]HET6711241.1 amino acid adenylation domain-containing protein [Amycolatopsis sp.]
MTTHRRLIAGRHDDVTARVTRVLGPTGPRATVVTHDRHTEITVETTDEPTARRLLDLVEEELSPRAWREWPANDTDRVPVRAGTVARQFLEQAGRTPEAVLLTGPEGDVTYAELAGMASAVAGELRDRGVVAGSAVGLLAGRTVAGIAGLWGVLLAGAAYLPLDPTQPPARLATLAADAGVAVCLAERAHAGMVPGAIALETVLARGHSGTTAVAPDAQDLAYLIYTSGSTGRPKCVEVTHGNLSTFTDWAIRVYGVHAGTRFPLFTSLAFDLSNTAVFLPALTGGSVALVPGELDHLVLRTMLAGSGSTALKLTPTHLDLIGRLGLRPEGYEAVIAGGELLRGDVAHRAQRAFGTGCRIFNEYGPTETTVGCMTRLFDPDRDAEQASVPIGVPTDNTRIHLLDEAGRFVEPGTVGEIHIAGAQVAKGYRGEPELTRNRFVRLADGTRAYRSGDLARLLPSGELESAGRDDEQLKINGYRIEPAEIAHALERHPAVARAHAMGVARPAGGKALAAFAVPAEPVEPAELLDHLRALLPSYQVPPAVIVVPELPTTHNGKIDNHSLAALAAEIRQGAAR